MTRSSYYQRMFYAAAIFNWIAAATVIFGASTLQSLGITTPFDPIGGQAFGIFAAVFGLGYYLVGRDITRNEGIVTLGIVGKALIFALFWAHAIAGQVQYSIAMMTISDAIFGILFVEFMLHGRNAAALSSRQASG
jgi:hypothetical protein